MKKQLTLAHVSITVADKQVVNDVSLAVPQGELHVVMGPNGSGKSSLLFGIMGNPTYQVQGKILINNIDITEKSPEERAQMGLLLAFQNPLTIAGVSIANLLRTAYQERKGKKITDYVTWYNGIKKTAQSLGLSEEFLKRSINDGFSGGEKKKAEMLQLITLDPAYVLFDEIDTGLDVDALRKIATGIVKVKKKGCGILLVTHYQRLLQYLTIDRVYVMKEGKLVRSGDHKLIDLIESKGYANI